MMICTRKEGKWAGIGDGSENIQHKQTQFLEKVEKGQQTGGGTGVITTTGFENVQGKARFSVGHK